MAKLMTVEEAVGYLRVGKKTIYRLLKQGKIHATKVGQQWRFNKVSIDKWLLQNPVGTGANILVVDDEEIIRSLFKKTLEELGHKVVAAETGLKGLELLKQRDFAMVFLDLKMHGMDGAEFFRQIKIFRPRLPVIIITSYPNSDIMARALAQAPFGLMNKPFDESDIITAVNTFLPVSTANSAH